MYFYSHFICIMLFFLLRFTEFYFKNPDSQSLSQLTCHVTGGLVIIEQNIVISLKLTPEINPVITSTFTENYHNNI